MATVNIGGRRVKVDDSFLSLSPEDQQKTVDEIETSLGGAAAPAAPAAPDTSAVYASPQADQPLRDAPASSDLPPTGTGFGTPAQMQPPSMGGDAIPPGRAAKLLAQNVGSGLTSALMFPLDVPSYIQHGLEWGVNKVTDPIRQQINQAAGRSVFPTSLEMAAANPQGVPDLGIPSERVKQGASWLAQKLGYEPAVPENLREKALSNVTELGTQAAVGSGLLSRLAKMRELELAKPGALPLRSDRFIQPYADQPLKTVAGDIGGGMAAGGALTGAQELPESVRKQGGGSVGTLADLIAMMAGGVSGGTLSSAVLNSPRTIRNTIRAGQIAPDISVNPATGMPTTNRTADEAAQLLQSITTNEPMSVARALEQRLKDFKDQNLPVPTTGLLTEDIGLAGLEKRQRTRAGPGTTEFAADATPEIRQQFSFGARDQALRDAAAADVQSIRPQGADPTIFPQRAADVSEMRLEQAQRSVDQPTGRAQSVQMAREAPATDVMTSVGQTPGASSNIFDVYKNTRALERTRSQALYARPEWTETRMDVTPMADAAAEIRTRATGSSPVTARAEPLLQRIEAAVEDQGGTLPGWEISKLNKDIEAQIKLALRDGEDFQQLKALKDSIAQTVTQLPAGSPPRVAIEAAHANTAERIVPNFREGTGGSLDLRLKTSPGQVKPETAGAEFLGRGQDAEQLMRIANLRGNAQEVATNARAIIFDQLAQGGVVKNGVIDPERLTQWRNKRTRIIDAVPGLGDEINTMIANARQGAGKASQYADEIAAAETRLAQTTKDVEGGPLGLVAGKDPQKAVGAIFASDNPARNMADLKKQMGNNPAANESLKAAVTDHFLARVKKLDPHGDAEFGVKLDTLIKDFEKNRAVLAQVLSPEDMQALQRAQTVLKPLTKRNVQATVGSTTAESSEAAMRPLELALKGYYGILKGGGVFRTVKVALKTLKGDTNIPVEQLITRAMFDPELAGTLLTRETAQAGTPAWNSQLQKLIRRNVVAKELATSDEGE